VGEIAATNGVSNTVIHLVYSHHHADHAGASSLFYGEVVRVGKTRLLLLRDMTGPAGTGDHLPGPLHPRGGR
jgi:glyoxylase-like metal-dependent hydrolase (beta-lactamase superfamily II)